MSTAATNDDTDMNIDVVHIIEENRSLRRDLEKAQEDLLKLRAENTQLAEHRNALLIASQSPSTLSRSQSVRTRTGENTLSFITNVSPGPSSEVRFVETSCSSPF